MKTHDPTKPIQINPAAIYNDAALLLTLGTWHKPIILSDSAQKRQVEICPAWPALSLSRAMDNRLAGN